VHPAFTSWDVWDSFAIKCCAPFAAIIGSGTMVVGIIIISVAIIREGWWWIYFAINAIELILAACQLGQLNRAQHDVLEYPANRQYLR
jgi:hypothetical protein